MNDASRLNPTPVLKHWRPKSDPQGALIEALRLELKTATDAGHRVTMGAARHSMGGQSLPRDGVAITFDNPWFEIDTANEVYRVSAGARWSEVIARLDPLGFSPKVMQSNNDFGVASTFCINAHGWPVPHGPFGSTVRALRLMLADGSLVECSRTQNAELFSLAMGGYGLFGIIVDLDVEMARNVLLAPTVVLMPGDEFADHFIPAVEKDPAILLAYGRLSVARRDFFSEALMTTYRAADPQPSPLPAATSGGAMTAISNAIYREQIGSEIPKRLRWLAESRLNPSIGSGLATRNSLLNEPVSNLANPSRYRTDILHEYFVPPQRFRAFLAACREVIPPAKAEFINVTLRYVGADETAVMAFAPQPRIAAVMSFSQEMSTEGEIDMLETTQRLIDRVIALDGAFYLPYRLHASRDQVEKAYPGTARFVDRKRFYDPKLLFRNAMWDAYFS
ncbi:FAD-binding oxidoreductase [Methylocapsa sp. S129]|uniref:FAD-binding oxidoreductase n=1 Tax=Methylocapsa sp. S129 TaxID=1641869 RepID=UPI00131D5346|nr:FAD-binding oxidoreductase [Methylocapsa sp. S129]